MQENPTSVLVVAAALVSPDGKICLHKRPQNKAHGGLWEFPGGKVEAGESPDCAIFREISEELGVLLDRTSLFPVTFASDAGDADLHRPPIVILLYSCRRWTGEVRCIEGEAIGWFEPDDISSLAMPPLDYPLARRLALHLRDCSI